MDEFCVKTGSTINDILHEISERNWTPSETGMVIKNGWIYVRRHKN